MTVWGKHCLCEVFIKAFALFKCNVPCQAAALHHAGKPRRRHRASIANRLRSMLYVDLTGSQAWFCCVCSSARHNASACNTSIQSYLLHITSDDAARRCIVRKTSASIANVRNQSCKCFMLRSSHSSHLCHVSSCNCCVHCHAELGDTTSNVDSTTINIRRKELLHLH